MLGHDPVDSDELEELRRTGGDLRSAWPARAALLGVVVFALAEVATLGAAWIAETTDMGPASSTLFAALVLYGSLVLAAVGVHLRAGEHPWRRAFGLHWRWSDVPWGFVLSIIARIAALVVVLPLVLIDEDLLGSNLPEGDEISFDVPILLTFTLVAVVLAPLVEELFFRGLIQRSLEPRLGRVAAVAIASTLFGLAHIGFDPGLGSVGIVLVTGVGGAVFGIATLVTKRLGTPIVAHAMFNAVPTALLWAVA